jgi:hypothetical protein
MKLENENLNKPLKPQLNIGAVMRSNIRLLIWGWCVMWGIIGGVFTVLWLWRYFA